MVQRRRHGKLELAGANGVGGGGVKGSACVQGVRRVLYMAKASRRSKRAIEEVYLGRASSTARWRPVRAALCKAGGVSSSQVAWDAWLAEEKPGRSGIARNRWHAAETGGVCCCRRTDGVWRAVREREDIQSVAVL
jgi:hypothetical protein